MEADVDLFTFHRNPMRVRADKVTGSFLAAAVGDAVGWPFEDRSRRVSPDSEDDIPDGFFAWERRAGTRFLAYKENIAPGTYSDDTQLLLATARSILKGEGWWEYFTRIELPMWPIYERGGGSATKRAVYLWLKGSAPWLAPDGVHRYFEAGGNGVCMRILPHVVVHEGAKDFHSLANAIVCNGIATHGHPRALLGGLLHGYVLWMAFRQRETLDYGELISTAINDAQKWSSYPDFPESWTVSASRNVPSYHSLWKNTAQELLDLLEIARQGIERGSLSTGYETLRELGAFDRRVNGAGTITAVAAVFLASRYAASPLQGLLAAATAHGSDTDTLSSMVGSILGAISGAEWLGHFGTSVQDTLYIRRLASELASPLASAQSKSLHAEGKPVTKGSNRKFLTQVESLGVDDQVTLPDGRTAVVVNVESPEMLTRNSDVRLWQLAIEDGQTITITSAKKAGHLSVVGNQRRNSLGLLGYGVELPVHSLAEARQFYVETLGLPIERESASSFRVGGNISVHQASSEGSKSGSVNHELATVLCLKVEDVKRAYDYLRERGANVITQVTDRQIGAFFYMRDPSGNVVKVFEARGAKA